MEVKSKEKIFLSVFFALLFFTLGFSDARAAVKSQCTGSCGGPQNCAGARGFGDSNLKTQCEKTFPDNCSNIEDYLAQMSVDCENNSKATLVGGNCNYIDDNDQYGACAEIYARYKETQNTGTCGGNCKETCDAVNENETTTTDCTAKSMKCCTAKTTPPSKDGIYIPTPEETGLPGPEGGIQEILKNLLTWLLEIVGVIALIGFIISGIQYIVSTGSEDMMEMAKRNMLYSIIGITVVLASFVIIKAIDVALRAEMNF